MEHSKANSRQSEVRIKQEQMGEADSRGGPDDVVKFTRLIIRRGKVNETIDVVASQRREGTLPIKITW